MLFITRFGHNSKQLLLYKNGGKFSRKISSFRKNILGTN
jgi:hypothetical protein